MIVYSKSFGMNHLKNIFKQHTLIIFVLLAILTLCPLLQAKEDHNEDSEDSYFLPHAQKNDGQYIKSGVVAAKGLVLGDNDEPYWVEYNKKGEVVSEFAEAYEEPYSPATVMSANDYKQIQIAFESIKQKNVNNYAILSREEYENKGFFCLIIHHLNNPH